MGGDFDGGGGRWWWGCGGGDWILHQVTFFLQIVKSGSGSWKRSEFHICSIATSILCCATTLSSNYRAVS